MIATPAGTTRRWELIALPFKACVVAVPVVLLLYTVLGSSDWLFHGGTVLDRMQARVFTLLMYGYLLCIAVLVLSGVLAHDKRVFRSTMIFAVLALPSLIMLYPSVVVPVTR